MKPNNLIPPHASIAPFFNSETNASPQSVTDVTGAEKASGHGAERPHILAKRQARRARRSAH